jgi:hypothetical protein
LTSTLLMPFCFWCWQYRYASGMRHTHTHTSHVCRSLLPLWWVRPSVQLSRV